jgi:hypothetical protein
MDCVLNPAELEAVGEVIANLMLFDACIFFVLGVVSAPVVYAVFQVIWFRFRLWRYSKKGAA